MNKPKLKILNHNGLVEVEAIIGLVTDPFQAPDRTFKNIVEHLSDNGIKLKDRMFTLTFNALGGEYLYNRIDEEIYNDGNVHRM